MADSQLLWSYGAIAMTYFGRVLSYRSLGSAEAATLRWTLLAGESPFPRLSLPTA